jgi:hypothetical protein
MSGVELIVAALAAGAGAGVTNTATAAVQDAYSGLKGLLGRWFGGREEARQALDADEVEPAAWQASIGNDLEVSGAATDDEVLAAARRLLDLVQPGAAARYQVNAPQAKGVQIGDHNTQTNTFS